MASQAIQSEARRLMIAAPELLDALKLCAAIVDSFLNGQGAVTTEEMNDALLAADSAIRKAVQP